MIGENGRLKSLFADMLIVRFQAVVHRHPQAGSVSLFACFNTPLHNLVNRVLLGHGGFPRMLNSKPAQCARRYNLKR